MKTTRPANTWTANDDATRQPCSNASLWGIAEYIRETSPWSVFFTERSVYDPIPPWLTRWRGDDVACQLGNPPLSSVILNAQRMGYEAAALLDRLMRGESPPDRETTIPPLEIVTRQSTDVTAIADPVVAQAMRFIREHACEGINVEDVVRHVLVSRSALQDHFRKTLDRSINDVIVGARTDRARELLAQTRLSLQDIAERAGFKHAEYMSIVFKQRTGWTPAKYREEHGWKTAKPFQIRRVL